MKFLELEKIYEECNENLNVKLEVSIILVWAWLTSLLCNTVIWVIICTSCANYNEPSGEVKGNLVPVILEGPHNDNKLAQWGQIFEKS